MSGKIESVALKGTLVQGYLGEFRGKSFSTPTPDFDS